MDEARNIRVALSLLALCVSGCAPVCAGNPSVVVGRYYSALSMGNFAEASGNLIPEDRRLLQESGRTCSGLAGTTWRHTKWELLDESFAHGRAKVRARLLSPNVGKLLGTRLALRIADDKRQDILNDELYSDIAEEIDSGRAEKLERVVEVSLTCSQGQWLIEAGYALTKRTNKMLLEALHEVNQDNVAGAIDIVSQVLAIDPGNVLAKDILKTIKDLKAEGENK